MALDNSFTGKGTGIELPSNQGVLSAQQGMNAMITKAEELRYEVYQKNRNEFLKNAAIDPVFILSDSARRYINGLTDNFNNTWGKVAQEKNYNLSTEDRMNQQTEKNFIIAEQQNQLAQQKMYQDTVDWAKQHPDMVDPDKLAGQIDGYMTSGKWDGSTMPIKSISPTSYFADYTKGYEGKWAEEVSSIGGERSIVKYPFNPKQTNNNAPDSPYTFFKNAIPKMPYQNQLGMIEEWDKSPDKQTYLKMADENNDGVYDKNEKQNAIVLWASKNPEYLNAAIAAGRVPETYNTPRAATTGKFNKNIPVNASNNKNDIYDIAPSVKLPTKYGTGVLTNFYHLRTETPRTIPLTISKTYAFDGQGNRTVKQLSTSDSVIGDITGYSPDGDMVSVKITTGGNILDEGDVVVLDAAEYDKHLKGEFALYRPSLVKANPWEQYKRK